MAARENQGLQIALIIFVMLTIILIVTTYFFFSSFQQERDKSKALTADNAKQDQRGRTAPTTRATPIKAAIGAASTDNKEAVLDQDQEGHRNSTARAFPRPTRTIAAWSSTWRPS